MSVFVDTSALVKLYVAEAGHEAMRAITEPLVVSRLTRVELPAALWGKLRRGEAVASDVAIAVSAFEADYYGREEIEPRFSKVQLDNRILMDAARLAARVDLRAGDAIQLASAVLARSAGRDVTTFATFDGRLRTAAAIEGFAVIPAQGNVAYISSSSGGNG